MAGTLKAEQVAAAAADLRAAAQTGTQMGLLSLRHPAMDLDDAYAIQLDNHEHALAHDAELIGWKIGLTSRAMQAALGIDTPDSGALYAHMRHAAGASIAAGTYIQPRIEAEIAFIMGAAVDGDATRDDVLAATAEVRPALEILDTRIVRRDPATGTARDIRDTVADNAANAGLVVGESAHGPTDHDLRWVGCVLSRDGVVEETGLGAGVLNDPVAGIVWLVRRLATQGLALEAGQLVLSGSFVRPVECPPGTQIEADFGSFGSVEIKFG